MKTNTNEVPRTIYEHVLLSPPEPGSLTSEADIQGRAIVNGEYYICQCTVTVEWKKNQPPQ